MSLRLSYMAVGSLLARVRSRGLTIHDQMNIGGQITVHKQSLQRQPHDLLCDDSQ